MTTKICNFFLLANKTETDLAEGISALTAKMARSPIYLFTDRESGLLPLAKSGYWQHNQQGLYSTKDLVIKFCPSLGFNHQNHASIEKLVESVKRSLGDLNLKGFD